MAQIRTYQPQIGATGYIPGPGVTPHASPADFGGGSGLAAAGQALQNYGDKLYDTQQRQEVTGIQAKLAQARADLTVKFQQDAAAAPAGDTTFADKFDQDASDYLDGLQGDIQTKAGQQAWQLGTANLKAHFSQLGGLWQTQSAGAKAVQDYNTLLNANRNTLLNDPSQYDAIVASTTSALDDPNSSYHNMPAATREKLKRQSTEGLATAAIEGMIGSTAPGSGPQEALRQLNAGEWDDQIGTNKATLEEAARREIRSRELDAEHKAVLAQAAQKDAWRKESETYYQQMLSGDPNVVQNINKSSLPVFGEFSKTALVNLVKAHDKPDPIADISHATTNDLFRRINLPPDDPQAITSEGPINQAFIDGKLTRTDMDWLRKQSDDRRTEFGQRLGADTTKFMRGYQTMIEKPNPGTGLPDPTGATNFYAFQRYVQDKMDEYRKAGKDPRDLINNPRNPEFLGRPEIVQHFMSTFQDTIDYMNQQMQRTTRPPLPGAAPAPPAAGTPVTPQPAAKRPSLSDIFGKMFGGQ